LIAVESVAGFIEENRGKIVLIGRVRNLNRWQDQIPEPDYRDENGPEGYALFRY
jgi:hypothetical protein